MMGTLNLHLHPLVISFIRVKYKANHHNNSCFGFFFVEMERLAFSTDQSESRFQQDFSC